MLVGVVRLVDVVRWVAVLTEEDLREVLAEEVLQLVRVEAHGQQGGRHGARTGTCQPTDLGPHPQLLQQLQHVITVVTILLLTTTTYHHHQQQQQQQQHWHYHHLNDHLHH